MPLHSGSSSLELTDLSQVGTLGLQGYLAHKKTTIPLGPHKDPKHRPTVGSYGGAFSVSEVPLYAQGLLEDKVPHRSPGGPRLIGIGLL